MEPTGSPACPPSAQAVAVAGLTKRYGTVEAIRDVSFEVGAGRIFGLLGPNGAGKTTTLECILGLRQADSGSIQIHGLDIRRHANRAKSLVGAQLQGATLQDKITARQALDLFGVFYPQSLSSEDLLGRFELENKADVPFTTLSGGQRQRLFLALALVNQPSVVVLDEPTAGLDPQGRRALRALIREIREEGRTVLLSTHDLDEAGQLCDEIAILDAGRIVAIAPPAELVAGARAPARVVVRTAPPLERGMIDSLPDLSSAAYEGGGWVLDTRAPNRLLADLVRRTAEIGAELLDVEFHRPSLEDAFIELTGHSWSGESERGEAS
jgi:ABC-2 type transport system ATP-binding protein